MENYKIEHVVKDPKTNQIRKITDDDLSIDNNPHVKQAFRVLCKMSLCKLTDRKY